MIKHKTQKKISLLNERIQECKKCDLCDLECNKKDISKGYGKLYGWSNGISKCRYLFIGMNPSHSRFPDHEHAFGGIEGSPGAGQKFNSLLKEAGVFDNIFVDNLVHCSSLSNSISLSQALQCFEYLQEEIKILKPIKIVAMGRQVFEMLNILLIEHNIKIPIMNIWHPSYVFSYQREKPEKYKEMIVKVCQEIK
jgi:uracil-DNA glycosylase family 4